MDDVQNLSRNWLRGWWPHWDFGGQDIYHGTHALFLKSCAVFPLLWTPGSEETQFHDHAGFTFRNQPLGYWLAYVRVLAGAQSPMLVIQAQEFLAYGFDDDEA